ncbi:MAG: glycosyltransferase, partial [Planctomycetia bacterium]|nr:glycosyltransferase [Planctomycetia bacterium]
MRIGTMIGDAAERIPLAERAVKRLRASCRARKSSRRTANAATQRDAYAAWVREHDTPTASDLAAMRESVESFVHAPTISVVMPVYNTPHQILEEAIESVRAQAYERWELCIADDVSTAPHVRAILERYAAADRRIKVLFRTSRGNISTTSNTALEMATGDFVALLDHDDILPPHALYWVAEAINRRPDAAILYSDEDKIDGDGRRFHPYFKCDFNHELFLAQNLVSHLGVYRRDLIVGLGGFRSEYDGSQDHDLALRVVAAVGRERVVHIPRVLYHWRAVSGSTAVSVDEKQYSVDAARRAVAAHLAEIGRGGTVEASPDAPGFHRVRHPLPATRPLVSIVICTRDQGRLLRTAVESITSRSTYDNYEIMIVDNGSRDRATLATLAELSRHGRVTVVRDDSPFNYAMLNNKAVGRS